jgi:uncharacterized protein (DUF2267 family)
LETLAERIPAGLATNLAAQLPIEISEHLRRVATAPDEPTTGVPMTNHEFFDRVAQRSGADTPKAVHEARCVMEVVSEATTGSVLDKVRQSLDEPLANTLFAGSTGDASSRT